MNINNVNSAAEKNESFAAMSEQINKQFFFTIEPLV